MFVAAQQVRSTGDDGDRPAREWTVKLVEDREAADAFLTEVREASA